MNLPQNSASPEQRDVLDALPVLVFLERDGKVVYANAEARHEIGAGGEGEWQECPVEEVLWGLFAGTAEPRTALAGSKRGSPFHATLACRDGRMTPVEGTYSVLDPETREGVVVAQVTGRDRSPGPALMEDVLASFPEAVAIIVGNNVLYTNPAFTSLFGFTAEDLSGGSFQELLIPETRLYEQVMLLRTVDDKGSAALDTVRLNKDGELVDVSLQMAALKVNGGRVGYVLTLREISERKQVEARLQHDAMHDVLTGLPNRALFVDRLRVAMSRRERHLAQSCAVFYMDLDHFKEINDRLGHAAGDMLLTAFADRLSRVLRPHDTAARIGGDEFAILVENLLSVADLDALAQRILAEFDRPFEVLGQRIAVFSSIGIALARENHHAPDELIRDADIAMYRAKQGGGHRYAMFDRHMEVQVTTQQERERELRDLVAKHDFVYWYQPMYRLATGRVDGFEMLLRRKTPAGTMDSFGDWLPVAEDTGLSISIGRDTVESACAQLQEWDHLLPGNGIILSLNLTRRPFYQEDVVAQLRKTLAVKRVDPARLMIEIAESTVNENPDRALVILQRMADSGVRIAVDNFGAGLASLNHLVRLPLDMIKLDSKLTASVTAGGSHLAVVQALIHVSKAAGLSLLAQGIETEEHLGILTDIGCELGQGYFLAPPVDALQAQYLASHSNRAVAFDDTAIR